jgi:hypothetical protein
VAHAAAVQVAVSILLLAVVKVPLVLIHSAPPVAGTGLLHVLDLVPLVPQVVAVHAVHALHPPSIPQTAVAAQDFVAALPHEFVQVVIVEAAVPQVTGQSGEQVIVPEGVQTQSAVAEQAFVVAFPHESVQVVMVEAAVPQAVGQSGEQVTVAEGTQAATATAFTVHSALPTHN